MVYKLGVDNINTEGKTTVYQFMVTKEALMMGYVIKSKEGKFVVIDGGYSGDPAIMNYLPDMLRNITGMEKPVIEAWFLTHIHEDHTSEFARLILYHSDEFEIKNIYFRFPKRDWLLKNLTDGDVQWHNFELLEKAFDSYYGTEGYLDRHEGVKKGDKFYIDDMEFEILLARNDVAKVLNDTSLVISMKADGQRILFLGDLYFTNGDYLAELYGSELKSDIVQMAHHGQNGVSFDVYKLIAPKVCLWPTPDWVWHNVHGHYQTTEVRQWMKDLDVKLEIVAGIDGSAFFTLPLEI